MARIKGTNVVRTVKWLRKNRDEARTLLSPRLHHYLDDRILISSWYPEEDHLELLRVAASLVAVPANIDRYAIIGRLAAHNDLAEVYKNIVQPGDHASWMNKAAALWRNYHDTGKMEATLLEPGLIMITLRDYEAASPEMCRIVGGYFEGVIEFAQGKVRKTTEVQCSLEGASECAWRIEYR